MTLDHSHEAQIIKAAALRRMHDRSCVLLLPNAWDAGTARVFAHAGFRAIATTSGGVAWSLGYPDGEHAPWPEVLAAIARIARAVDLPVTADIEAGYGQTPDAVAATVRDVIGAGAVGINLEDGLHAPGSLRDLNDAARRIAAARAAADHAGVPIVINARIDTYLLKHSPTDATRFAETVRRARAYLAAGADCVFPLALTDGPTMGELVKAINAPVNVAARPGLPDLAELARLGVARVSTATRFATLALGAVEHAAKQLLETGRFEALDSSLTHPDMQRLMEGGPGRPLPL